MGLTTFVYTGRVCSFAHPTAQNHCLFSLPVLSHAGIQEQLENACTAASEGMAAVQSVRSALADWWTLPALKAAPWLKREWLLIS